MDCQDEVKWSKTVPFNKITDCVVEEPAGASGPCCCMTQNVLTRVHVDTVSSGGQHSSNAGEVHEITFQGLKSAAQFKKDVWSMKRGEGLGVANSAPPPNAVAPNAVSMAGDRGGSTGLGMGGVEMKMGSKGASGGQGNEIMVPLLREQNDLMKENNRLLEKLLKKN